MFLDGEMDKQMTYTNITILFSIDENDVVSKEVQLCDGWTLNYATKQMNPTNKLNRQELINSVLEGLKATDEVGQPNHYVICHAYTGHEERISEELSTIEQAVDELIYYINNYETNEDDLYYSIDGYWEESECLWSLHIHELNEYDEEIHG